MLDFKSHIERAEYALIEARTNLNILKEASSIPYEKMAWFSFLTSIDGVRQSLVEAFKGSNKHNKWYSKFAADMKNDELLIYMRNARNNAQHIVTKAPLNNQYSVSIFDKNGKGFPIDSITSTVKDGTLNISLESKDLPDDVELDADFSRLQAEALEVINQGKKYPTPSKHQGVHLFSNEITYLAEITLEYYESIVNEADKHGKDS